MTLQFQSVRMDGTQGEWHDLMPGQYAHAPAVGWAGFRVREKPEPTRDDAWRGVFPDKGEPWLDEQPAAYRPCTCDGGASGFHAKDCPT